VAVRTLPASLGIQQVTVSPSYVTSYSSRGWSLLTMVTWTPLRSGMGEQWMEGENEKDYCRRVPLRMATMLFDLGRVRQRVYVTWG